MNNKIWAFLVHLSMNCYINRIYTDRQFEDEAWNFIVDNASKSGLNTLILDIGDGVEFSSHPEIALKDAWSKKRLKEEIKKCNDKGLTLIPKLDFSTTHGAWLGKYRYMISTPEYYHFCNDLIQEVYEIFDAPEYIHIGMDEEDAAHSKGFDFVVFRRGELLWHDLRFLLDCVHSTGAKPWLWHDMAFNEPEEYKKRVSPDEAVICPWYYHAFRKEMFTQMKECEPEIKYIETEAPILSAFRDIALPFAKGGYTYVPTSSTHVKRVIPTIKYDNSYEIMNYFKAGVPDNQILGYMNAPWCGTLTKNLEIFADSFETFKAAKEIFYK